MMEWQAVSSSNVAEIGYDKETNTLGIRFLPSNSEYHYPLSQQATPLDESFYQQLLNADSKGRFVNDNIRYTLNFRKVR